MMLFDVGYVVATPGAIDALERAGVSTFALLVRHAGGDWGEVHPDDARENELSVEKGYRVMSVYPLPGGHETVWVITEADRSATTFLMPEEY